VSGAFVSFERHRDMGLFVGTRERAGRAYGDELRARQFPWPPLRLARVCLEHESVTVVCPSLRQDMLQQQKVKQ
jgi:hypothetical protein